METRLWSVSLSMVVVLSLGSCGGAGKSSSSDAPPPPPSDGALGDAAEPPLALQNNEGGEIRLEWIQNAAGATTSRADAYFYKSQTPAWHTLPAFPGCIDVRAKDTWPFAQGTITPLDVGGVIIHPTNPSNGSADLELTRDSQGMDHTVACSTSSPCPAGSMCNAAGYCATTDALARPHDLWYKKAANFAANDGSFFPADQGYSVFLTGSSEWPPQVFEGSIGRGPYMPSDWAPVSPPTNATVPLLQDTDLVLTFNPDASTALPAGYKVNTVVAFTGTGFAGPIVFCQVDGTPATLTVPAAMVNIIRQYTPGAFSRIHLTHHLEELTDGTPRPTADRKRIDMLTIWCYATPWAAM